MKKKGSALALCLALLAGLAVPALAAPAMDAYEACQALEEGRIKSRDENDFPLRGKFLVDFDQDGVPEMVAVYFDKRSGWGSVAVYYLDNSGAVREGDSLSLIAGGSNFTNDISVVHFGDGTYGLNDDGYARYGEPPEWNDTMRYSGNGKLTKTSAKGTVYYTLDSYDLELPGLYAFFPKPAEPVAPPLPDVPAAPLGSGLAPAPAQAIAALSAIPYSGDPAAITMTKAQAQNIRDQIAWYAGASPDYRPEDAYVTLFDTGAGVPGLFMAKGQSSGGGVTPVDGKAYYEHGQAAVWAFQGGESLSLVAASDPSGYRCESFTLYPACVACCDFAPDGSHEETRYYAMGYGSISTAPGSTLVNTVNDMTGSESYSVDGARVNAKQYQEFEARWQGAGMRAYASQGGGVEYIIAYMTPAGQVVAALDQFIAACEPAAVPVAYAAAQSVEVDGKAVEFQMYALKDEAGNPTNYVRVRDLASVLSGTAAQFDVGYSGTVDLVKGRAYAADGSEMRVPFRGDRAYVRSNAATNVDGRALELDSIALTDDQGGGYTYYQLRDLGKALGFHVDWSAERGVYIETK